MAGIPNYTIDDKWLCTKQVARLTGLSPSFFEKARMRGRDNGPAWHRIGGRVRYRKSDLLAWLDACRVSGGEVNA
jgi:predicted DNA-binding transcriptional regulator AlpA